MGNKGPMALSKQPTPIARNGATADPENSYIAQHPYARILLLQCLYTTKPLTKI